MPKVVVQAFEMVNIRHNDSHSRFVAAGALDFFHDAQLKETAVKYAGQAVQVGKLLHTLDVVRILDGSSADVSHRLQRLQVALAEDIPLGTMQCQNAQGLTEGDQRNTHSRGGFGKEFDGVGSFGQVLLNDSATGGEDARPRLAVHRETPALWHARCQGSVMGAQYQVVVFAQEQGNMRNLERLLNHAADTRQ